MEFNVLENKQRKIIHVDMDCFYAAIEIRDNPSLSDKPVAVGAASDQRGVICTSNYIARQYGIKSAMPTATAMRLCKNLVLLPVNMAKYKKAAANIHQIFKNYTDLVEPLSLDEAYLDVTGSPYCKGSATFIAQAIRHEIWEAEHLIASAGVAPNKFLAKIASGWKKPNGLFVINPSEVGQFVQALAVEKLHGVGKVTAEKLHNMGFKTCADLQRLSFAALREALGKCGERLYEQCRGIDNRAVLPNRERKSLSVEHTFSEDMNDRDICLSALKVLYEKLMKRVGESASDLAIKNQFVKIKFNNFRVVSSELSSAHIDYEIFKSIFMESYLKVRMPVRLLGVGVHFYSKEKGDYYQYSFF